MSLHAGILPRFACTRYTYAHSYIRPTKSDVSFVSLFVNDDDGRRRWCRLRRQHGPDSAEISLVVGLAFVLTGNELVVYIHIYIYIVVEWCTCVGIVKCREDTRWGAHADDVADDGVCWYLVFVSMCTSVCHSAEGPTAPTHANTPAMLLSEAVRNVMMFPICSKIVRPLVKDARARAHAHNENDVHPQNRSTLPIVVERRAKRRDSSVWCERAKAKTESKRTLAREKKTCTFKYMHTAQRADESPCSRRWDLLVQ